MKQKKKAGRPDGGRIFRSGVYSTAILAAAVVLAVLVNLVVQAIPVRYTEFDLSEGGLYTLGSTSAQLAGSLEQDVTIYYLCETGSEDAIITGLLDQYAAAGSHIRWQQIDPAVYPTFAARYGAETVSTGSLILDAGSAAPSWTPRISTFTTIPIIIPTASASTASSRSPRPSTG